MAFTEREIKDLLSQIPREEKEMLLRVTQAEREVIMEMYRQFPGMHRTTDVPTPAEGHPE